MKRNFNSDLGQYLERIPSRKGGVEMYQLNIKCGYMRDGEERRWNGQKRKKSGIGAGTECSVFRLGNWKLEMGNGKWEMNEFGIDCSSAIPPNSSTTTCPQR
ncbi:hypothetical protein VNO80_23040 [Phaseolus coccineus]|uniref:Uncharacterized protein n=1 Tax=Phaseolus coccineus TaxID=3886 RepID=A0AAN9QUM3_PHACN